MFRHKRVTITGQNAIEVVENVLTGTADKVKTVHGIFVLETTSTKQNDAIIKVWLEQELITEIPYPVFLDCVDVTNPLRISPAFIPVGVNLAEGKELNVGILSGATLSVFEVVVEYEQGD